METLPVYCLTMPRQPALDHIQDFATNLFGIENFSLNETNGRHLLSSSTQLIDVNAKSGAIWAADLAKLWNPTIKPQLPDKPKAHKIADEFVRKSSLFPTDEREDRFMIEPLNVAGSYVSTFYKKTGEREDRQLDYRVRY